MLEDQIRKLNTKETEEQLAHLYGTRAGMVEGQKKRYEALLKQFGSLYGDNAAVRLISAPGRTEIGGNHTDHNLGKVLAASVNLDTVAAVAARNDLTVRLKSEGYDALTLDLGDLQVHTEEEGTTAALIRGVAAKMQARGLKIGGFDAAVTSTVASGSGLSSSAAFEVMVCAILDSLYNGSVLDRSTRAKICQYAENVYFGKPSGLLDQMASSVGGLVTVDFGTEGPDMQALSYDFSAKGYALVVTATGGSHADLTPHYAAIPSEMKAVAACFGKEVLRQVPEENFRAAVASLRGKVSDRAILRAMHFYAENHRVEKQVAALQADDLTAFLEEIRASGRSSFMYLQNVVPDAANENLALALAMAEEMLGSRGAWRVHGGGFAGTTLNFVPNDLVDAFVQRMDETFGKGACHILAIRPEGPAELKLSL